MGVYIFQSLVDPAWIKVGHHRVTKTRPNVWYRVARRGFNSCVCPRTLAGKTHVEQLALLAFYSNLTTKEEKQLHRENKVCRTGEWYKVEELPRIKHFLEHVVGGVDAAVTVDEKNEALRWANK